MATIKLIPSTYYLSSSSYLSVSNASNMYSDTDSSTYATVTNSRTSTTSYYVYIRGFDFDAVPSNAIVNSFSIKVKCNYSGGYSSGVYLFDGTAQSYGDSGEDFVSSTVKVLEISTTYTWDDIVSCGSDLGLRINCRRSSRNTTSYIYIYGAEIDVDYTLPTSATVTSTLSGDGTISPSGDTSTYEGAEYTLTITPTNKSDTVTATKDGADITSQLVAHGVGGSEDRVLGDYSLVSGRFNGSGASYFQGIEGNGVDASKTTSNYYSSSSSSHAVFQYGMSFSLPSNAVVERVYCEVNGHAESTSQSSEYMCVQLKSGSTELSEQINFKDVSTSNTTITLECETLPTVTQLENMVLECTLGYYGGAINGATCYVVYSVPSSNPDHWTYTFTVTGDAVISVTIGGSVATASLYVKRNGTWTKVSKGFKKVNGSWIETALDSLFESGVNYKAEE